MQSDTEITRNNYLMGESKLHYGWYIHPSQVMVLEWGGVSGAGSVVYLVTWPCNVPIDSVSAWCTPSPLTLMHAEPYKEIGNCISMEFTFVETWLQVQPSSIRFVCLFVFFSIWQPRKNMTRLYSTSFMAYQRGVRWLNTPSSFLDHYRRSDLE